VWAPETIVLTLLALVLLLSGTAVLGGVALVLSGRNR
jgi:hypothetical protein